VISERPWMKHFLAANASTCLSPRFPGCVHALEKLTRLIIYPIHVNRWCGRRRCRCCCRGHRPRCCRAGRNRRLFLGNRFLWRLHRLQGDVNRIGCEPRGSTRALRIRPHRHRLRLIAAQGKCDGELAAGLDRELAGRARQL